MSASDHEGHCSHLNFSKNYTSKDQHVLASIVVYNFNSHNRAKGLIKVTGSHVCQTSIVFETVQDKYRVAIDHYQGDIRGPSICATAEDIE